MLLKCLIGFLFLWTCSGQGNEGDSTLLVEEKNLLSPPYFNIATGKQIDATATCGTSGPELFCKLTGGTNFEYRDSLYQGQVCDVCNAHNSYKSHPVNNAIDGTEKWWQSPPLSRGTEYNRVNVTVHLGQVFHVAYVLVKFANSPRAGTWVLERSSDNGKTFHPWQYFANTDSDCYNLFGMSSLDEIRRDDSVICTSEYSGAVPLENGEVIISLIKGRPGAQNFSYSTVLQEWSMATDVRLRLLRTKTLLGHLMAVSEEDPTVTRRYYYSIKDISIGGRCVCNGHADTCEPDPLDQYKSKCTCQHNTCGESCERCCPGFEQKQWKPAVPGEYNECEACNCHGHSDECFYDEDIARRRLSLDLQGNYEGGGVCQNCLHNTAGINCEQCAPGYWRPRYVSPHDPRGCRACQCDSVFTLTSCEPTTGRCYCKEQYSGYRCDRCAPGFYDFPECKRCDCYYNGTLDEVCTPVDVFCPCKYNFAGMYCDRCADGFFNFPQCEVCQCNGQGSVSDRCDPVSGACECSEGFSGNTCSECAPGYFSYPLCQRCQCSEIGTTNEVCDLNTGQCLCEEKFSGSSCNQCKRGFFSFPQCYECECTLPGSNNNDCDRDSGRCRCLYNYQGPRCEQCAPGFYDYPNCSPCICNPSGSMSRICNPQTGQCSCRDNIKGLTCDTCNTNYFNFPHCDECSCDVRGIASSDPNVCLAFTTGQCNCKENVMGVNCDQCKPSYYDLDRGCIKCNCFLPGTLDGVGECDEKSGLCWCKTYTHTHHCSQCQDNFYSLQQLNYFGCRSCMCDVGGATSLQCDKITGQCKCRIGVEGRRCSDVMDNYFHPTLYQNQYEVEYSSGRGDRPARTGFDDNVFPGYSMNGYVEFSTAQHLITMAVDILNDGLYRIVFRFLNSRSSPAKAVATLNPFNLNQEGERQVVRLTLPVTANPHVITSTQTLVLNRGKWRFTMAAPPDVLLDYFVLLPIDYYEPTILDQTISEPCAPTLRSTEERCVMFSHFNLDSFSQIDLVHASSSRRKKSLSTSHPPMRYLDGINSGANNNRITTNLRLPQPGKYVLVLEYASTEQKLQQADVSVNDGYGNSYDHVKFNIYHCNYLFLCRQVALSDLNDVAVFESASSFIEVNIEAKLGEAFYLKTLTAILFEEWSMEKVDPMPKCLTTKSPEFESCLRSSYDFPVGSVKFPAATADSNAKDRLTPRPPMTSSYPVVVMDGSNPSDRSRSTLQIPMSLNPGRYVFLVHYYNPDHTSFQPEVVVEGGFSTIGSFNLTFCPNENGCVAALNTATGTPAVNIYSPTSTITIVAPNEKSFWIQDVYAIPEDLYRPSSLSIAPEDISSQFLRKCSQDSFYKTLENPSDFCQKSVMSLTVNHNNGALKCDCSRQGSVGGRNAICEKYGGQCPCRSHVIGRQCDRCQSGYFDFPRCVPCNCNGKLCDPISGECICPPNTKKPQCTSCIPLTHSFHPLDGCIECDCSSNGVVYPSNRTCNPDNGQCDCKEFVTGQKCNRCKPGYFGFPDCQPCTCNKQGSMSELCHPETGQCLCKENVEGLQCDRCKMGSFYLNPNDLEGCTKCFCFGVPSTPECHSVQYPTTYIQNMYGWEVTNVKNSDAVSSDGETAEINVYNKGGAIDISTGIYWIAPEDYLNDKTSSYGGELSYSVFWDLIQPSRGDAINSTIPPLEQPIEVLLLGNQFTLGWTNQDADKNSSSRSITLKEHNFKHVSSGSNVTRAEMMMVLSDLQILRILAAPTTGVTEIRLSNVTMEATNYSLPIASAPGIPVVEECVCPQGYRGHSCQECDVGYYRVKRGPYLGYCEKCDCYGHCDTCDETGRPTTCLHNTKGPNCDMCKDGFIGNAKSGEVDACTPCPCPNPTPEGNFANTCEYSASGEVICHCEMGYMGDKCDECETGYFGNPNSVGGWCRKCNCHGNGDPNMIREDCDPVTGECNDCAHNTGGRYCERCADGYYGNALSSSCTECDCMWNGTDSCDHLYGYCQCKPHVVGWRCSSCEPGYYGFDSKQGCQNCLCAEAALSRECNPTTGQCACAPNTIGRSCDRCAPGYWNYDSRGCQPCSCHNNARCNPNNGQCQCPIGVTGAQCDKCVLNRHVLEPGATECSRCDKCVDELLDTVEMMTDDVREAVEKLSNSSIGSEAIKRLEELQDRAEEIEKIVEMDEEFVSSDVDDMYSGSGDISSSSKDNYENLEKRLEKLEVASSRVCNQSKKLLKQVEKSDKRSKKTQSDSEKLKSDAEKFYEVANDLLQKIIEGSPADANEKLKLAEEIVKNMTERDMTSLKNIADDELQAALDVLHRVEEGFTFPATNISERVQKLLDEFEQVFKKLRELRTLMNNATAMANNASTTNAVNQRNLADTKANIEDIDADFSMASRDVKDAERMIAAAEKLKNGPIAKGLSSLEKLSENLEKQTNALEPVATELQTGVAMYEPLLNQSIEALRTLETDAQKLERLAETRYDDGVQAANRYRELVDALKRADEAADLALETAREAKETVTSQNFEEKANKIDARSETLLSETEKLSDVTIVDLQAELNEAKKNVSKIKKGKNKLNKSVEQLTKDINMLDWGNILDEAIEVNKTASSANKKSQRAIAEADELEKFILNVTDDGGSNPNYEDINNMLLELKDFVKNMKDEADRANEASQQFASLQESLNLNSQIRSIQKRIELTRSKANLIKDPIKFSSDENVDAKYVQLRVPLSVQGLDKYLEVSFDVQIDSTSPDSQLLYYGDKTKNGDYVSVESVSGRVKYRYKVGDGVGELESDVKINNNKKSTIKITRSENKGELLITYPSESRSDLIPGIGLAEDRKRGETGNFDIVSSMDGKTDKLYFGGYNLAQPPPGLGNLGSGNFCLSRANVNNEELGMWNFVSYDGTIPGESCTFVEVDPETNEMWRFRGQGSYLRIPLNSTTFNSPNRVSHFVGFNLMTLQANSFLLLIGNSFNQFMALQMENGKLVLYWNFGFSSGPRNETVLDYNEIAEFASVIIKAGIIKKSPSKIAVQINSIQKPFPYNGTVAIEGDIWIGGMWPYEVQPELRSFLSTSGTSLRGCMNSLTVNNEHIALQDAIENVGVTRGCSKESVYLLNEEVSSLFNPLPKLGSMKQTGYASLVGGSHPADNKRGKYPPNGEVENLNTINARVSNEQEEKMSSKLSLAFLIVIGIVIGIVLVSLLVIAIFKSYSRSKALNKRLLPEQISLNEEQSFHWNEIQW